MKKKPQILEFLLKGDFVHLRVQKEFFSVYSFCSDLALHCDPYRMHTCDFLALFSRILAVLSERSVIAADVEKKDERMNGRLRDGRPTPSYTDHTYLHSVMPYPDLPVRHSLHYS